MKLPYGYVLIGKEIAVHEEKADVVRSIFEYYLAGASLGKVVDMLFAKGIAQYLYADPAEAMTLKLDAYQELKTQAPMAAQVATLATTTDKNENIELIHLYSMKCIRDAFRIAAFLQMMN